MNTGFWYRPWTWQALRIVDALNNNVAYHGGIASPTTIRRIAQESAEFLRDCSRVRATMRASSPSVFIREHLAISRIVAGTASLLADAVAGFANYESHVGIRR